jgi:hypothetical protein
LYIQLSAGVKGFFDDSGKARQLSAASLRRLDRMIGATKSDWPAYLKKSVLGSADTRKALHEFLKFGKAAKSRRPDESWNEFIFEAYHRHQTEAIFLAGLPDIKGSLPHAESR